MERSELEAFVRRSRFGYRAVVPHLGVSVAAPSRWGVKASAATKARAALGLPPDAPDPLVWAEERRAIDRVTAQREVG